MSSKSFYQSQVEESSLSRKTQADGTRASSLFTDIEGARVDNLEYLDKYNIDRNMVSKELSRIFSQMVYLNGEPIFFSSPLFSLSFLTRLIGSLFSSRRFLPRRSPPRKRSHPSQTRCGV